MANLIKKVLSTQGRHRTDTIFYADENEAVGNRLTVLQWHTLYKDPK